MSVRALSLVAGLLLALLLAVAWLTADRFGYLGLPEPPGFVFQNSLLRTELGQRLILRPLDAAAPRMRLTMVASQLEPETEDRYAPLPYALFVAESRRKDEEHFTREKDDLRVRYLLYQQMGALTGKEWLEEIRLVTEISRDGGQRTLLRAIFGHENGAQVAYFYDPARPVPVVGWFRQEVYGGGNPIQLLYAADGGRLE